jgi:hypothetical protein
VSIKTEKRNNHFYKSRSLFFVPSQTGASRPRSQQPTRSHSRSTSSPVSRSGTRPWCQGQVFTHGRHPRTISSSTSRAHSAQTNPRQLNPDPRPSRMHIRTGRTSTHGGSRPTSSRARARVWRSSTSAARCFCARSLGVSTAGVRGRPLLPRVVSVLFALHQAMRTWGWDTRASSSSRMPRRLLRLHVRS